VCGDTTASVNTPSVNSVCVLTQQCVCLDTSCAPSSQEVGHPSSLLPLCLVPSLLGCPHACAVPFLLLPCHTRTTSFAHTHFIRTHPLHLHTPTHYSIRIHTITHSHLCARACTHTHTYTGGRENNRRDGGGNEQGVWPTRYCPAHAAHQNSAARATREPRNIIGP